jgi:hypothetical protein
VAEWWKNQRFKDHLGFKDHLCPHLQGADMDMVGNTVCPVYICPSCVHSWPLANGDCWTGSSDHSAWTSFLVGQQVGYRVPDRAQCKATVPVKYL